MKTYEYSYHHQVHYGKLESLLNEQAVDRWEPAHFFPLGDVPSSFGVLLRRDKIEERKPLEERDLMSDYDVLTKWMKYSPEEAEKMITRNKIQKLEDLKLQVVAQNPSMLGVGMPFDNESQK